MTGDRYARQRVLPSVGPEGQARLAATEVLVIGAGGLGSTVLPVLAGAGIGRITIVDHDVVDLSNLHRQPLYGMADQGRAKAEAARDALLARNPEIAVEARVERLRPGNAAALVASAGIVVDCADSLAVTYMLSAACMAAEKPLVTASALEQRGYAGGFCGGAPSYRAVFPDMPSVVGSCAQNGVLGSAVAAIGAIEAHMVLQIALELTPSPLGRLVSLDLSQFAWGGFRFDTASEPHIPAIPFLERGDLDADTLVVELRGRDEAPVPVTPDARRSSLAEIASGTIPQKSGRIAFACASGVRAYKAARILQARGHEDVAVLLPE